jgi:hypothetical protein
VISTIDGVRGMTDRKSASSDSLTASIQRVLDDEQRRFSARQ